MCRASPLSIFKDLSTLLTRCCHRFVATALVGDEQNIQFEYHLGFTGEDKAVGRTCLFSNDGNMADFIHAVRGGDLEGQSWLKYNSIG